MTRGPIPLLRSYRAALAGLLALAAMGNSQQTCAEDLKPLTLQIKGMV